MLAFALICFSDALAQQGAGLKPKRAPGAEPVTLEADRIEGVSGRDTSAQGNVTLRRDGLSIRADSLKYNEGREDVEANGNVHFERKGDVLTGTALKYHMRDSTGVVVKPEYSLAPRTREGQKAISMRGQAESIELIGEDQFLIKDGSFTSCKPGDDGWPALIAHADDYSAENRLIGALGLRDQRFEYAFTDVFEPGRTRFGPGAAAAVGERLRRVLED